MNEFRIRLTEELILLMLDESSGYLEMVPGWDFSCVLAAAVIADLALENRIDTDLQSLYLLDDKPTGDSLLDPTLEEIAKSENGSDTQYWVERTTVHAEYIVTRTLERLVDKGVLDYESGGFWTRSRTVSRSGVYPSADGAIRKEAKVRILNVILNDDIIPDPRDIILVGLMHTCDGFKLLLSDEDYAEKLERIETVAGMDLVGRTVATAAKNSTVKPRTRRVLTPKPIPKLPVADILRGRDFLAGNIPKAMCGILEKHGPVVKAPIRMHGQPVVALMGLECNNWVNKQGRFYLRTKDYIQGLEGVFGASRTMPGMDGAEHHKMRKSLRGAYSRATLAERLPELMFHCRESISALQEGEVFGATKTFQDLMSKQVSHLTMGVDTSQFIDELLAYEHRALTTHVQSALPGFMLSTPKMRRARRHVRTLVDAIHASSTPAQRRGKPPNVADAIFELHRTDPQFLPETDMTFPFVAAMVASIYLGSALAFAVHAMIADPDLHAGVRKEADSLFGGCREPLAGDFDNLDNIDITHRLFLESERVYPVIPWQLRTVMNQCVVGGFELLPKTRLVICHTATHYSADLFTDPLKFDIDRFLPERRERIEPGAYVPYGLGTHTCLGHRWLELQMVVNLLLIAHHVDLQMLPANYKMRINPFPTLAPRKKLKFRVAKVRNAVRQPSAPSR